MENKFNEIQTQINYSFKNLEILREALTTPRYGNQYGTTHYENLETLGDAVLKTILITKKIEDSQGMLNPEIITKTKQALENNDTLIKIAKHYFTLQEYIIKAEDQVLLGKDKKILADIFEALCGAVYLDSRSLKAVEEGIVNRFYKDWNKLMDATIFYKSDLNEYLQNRYRFNAEILYDYTPIGPQEDKYWIIKHPRILDPQGKVLHEFPNLKSKPFKTKKKAEQHLSKKILNRLENST